MATTTKKTTKTKTTQSTAKRKTAPRRKNISAEDIRIRAAQIYQERVNAGKQGDELSDWLTAERELSQTK